MVKIKNYNNLIKDIESYKEMFPQSYTKLEDVKSTLEKDYEQCGGGNLGIEVSSEWKSKCYHFEYVCGEPLTYIYYGIAKC